MCINVLPIEQRIYAHTNYHYLIYCSWFIRSSWKELHTPNCQTSKCLHHLLLCKIEPRNCNQHFFKVGSREWHLFSEIQQDICSFSSRHVYILSRWRGGLAKLLYIQNVWSDITNCNNDYHSALLYFLSVVTSCIGLWKEAPQTAHLMSFVGILHSC